MNEKDEENEQMRQTLKILTSQIEKLTNEANKNKQEIITIFKQIQELHYTRKKLEQISYTKSKQVHGKRRKK